MTRSTQFTRRTRIIRWISTLAVTLVATLAVAAPDSFVAANAAAARGDHAAAAKAFEHAIASDGWSANALLGLANAYASTGDNGRALLALERAHMIAPRDPAINDNLARMRETAGLDAPSPSAIDRAVGSLTADTWAWASLGGLAFACAGVIGIAWTQRRRRLSTIAVICGAVISVGAALAAREVAPKPNEVVLVEPEEARIAPFAEAETAFNVRAGERGLVEQRRGDFVYVRVDAERAGWVRDSAIEHIIPSERRSDDS